MFRWLRNAVLIRPRGALGPESRTARPDCPDRTFRDHRSAKRQPCGFGRVVSVACVQRSPVVTSIPSSNTAQGERRASAFRRRALSLRVDRRIDGTYPVERATISRLTTGRTEMDETMQAHHGIVIRAARVVPARPEEVYRMFIDAALMPKWWGKTAKAVLLACEMDPRAGGRFRFALRTEKGAEDVVSGH